MTRLEPVELFHERDHAFLKPETKPKRGKGRCQHCGQRYGALEHLGAPQSLNVAGSGGNHFAYQATKQQWQERFTALIAATSLPHGLSAVTAEAQVCFPDRIRRDQGNFRYMVEKALGDALVAGGWLTDDNWFPERRYEFGQLEATYVKGRSWLRVVLFPTAAAISPSLPEDAAPAASDELDRKAA